MIRIHASCVAIDGRGLLLMGPPGAGKSDLALRLIDRGAALVGDDGLEITAVAGRLRASVPATIAGALEVRGIGIVDRPYISDVPLALCLALDHPPERMPPDVLPMRRIEGIDLPELAFAGFENSAPLKAELALQRWGIVS
jgi:hypothetical protein